MLLAGIAFALIRLSAGSPSGGITTDLCQETPHPPGRPRPSNAPAVARQRCAHLQASQSPGNSLRPVVHTSPTATTARDNQQTAPTPRLPGPPLSARQRPL